MSAFSSPLNSTDIVWNVMTMNLTQLTTLVALSACAIAESPTVASANGIPTPAAAADIQVPSSIVQLENATIQSIAQPETLSQMPEVLTPEVLTSEVLTPATVAAANGASAPSIAAPMEPVVELAMGDRTADSRSKDSRSKDSRSKDSRSKDSRSKDSRAVGVRPIASHIQVGTQGIPPVTDLPEFISLPQESLLPTHFKYPIVLGQAMDSTILTASPITDQMADPVWSRRMEDLAAYKAAYSENLKAWSGSVAQCMTQKPKLYVLQPVEDKKLPPIQLPVYFNGTPAKDGKPAIIGKEGTIVQNKDGVSVCAM